MKKKLKNAILLILATSLILTTLAACQNTAADKSRVETTTVTTTAEPTTEETTVVETTTEVTTTIPKPTAKKYELHERSPQNMDPMIENKIREDYVTYLKKVFGDSYIGKNAKFEEVHIYRYCGTYNFGDVVFMGGGDFLIIFGQLKK